MDEPRPGDPNENPNKPANQPVRPQGQPVSGVMPTSGVMLGGAGQTQGWTPPPGVYTPPPPSQPRPVQPTPGALTARVTSTFFYVKSIEKSVEFYSEALGAQLAQRHAEVEGGPLTLAIMKMGDFSLMLHIADEDDPDLKDNRVGVGIHLQLRVSNVDAAYDRACDAGYHAKVSDGPVDQEWGWREFAIKDPDGYIWSVYQDKTNGSWSA
jgi:uncharacterized glyoxalase superfamily protein PhnB